MNALFLLAFAAVLGGCNKETSIVAQVGEVEVAPSLLDFGTVFIGANVENSFTVVHLGGPAVDIVSVSVVPLEGEGFTVVDGAWSRVDADAPVELKLRFAPTFAGPHAARVTVITDSADQAQHVAEVRGVAADLLIDLVPPVVDFGPVAAGAFETSELSLFNRGTLPIDLVDVRFDDPRFSTLVTTGALAPGGRVDLPLRYTADVTEAVSTAATLDFGLGNLRTATLRANDCVEGDAARYDRDGDGVSACAGDCDDRDPSVHPGARETCDGADDDCDTTPDNGTECFDDDGDGFSEDAGDCHDADARIHPDAAEDFDNGLDDDCDGVTDRGDGDLDHDGYDPIAGDCNDANATMYPGAPEVADLRDNDCDGTVDEDTAAYDDDGDGKTEFGGDCNDGDAAVYPGAAELADGVDNDCDRKTDEGTPAYDDDGDGFSENGGDCNDANAAVSPAAFEVNGNAADEDCDGHIG